MSEQRLADLVEALRGDQVGVDIDDVVYRLPQRTVLEWAGALLDSAPDAIVPGLLDPTDAEALYDRLMDEYEPLDIGVCEDAGLWLLEQVAHRPWWEARRAILHALDMWEAFDAWCTHACNGLDATTLPVGRFCNLVVRYLELHIPEDNREMWRAGFAAPPAGVDLGQRPEWSDEAIAADSEAAMDDWAGMVAAVGSASPD
jgi:hypothetical protein